ncbi:MBL fold metallo-hydrolase [Brevibacillus borstelensis]|uniref:MBL fold metallo-hydrolase n=1 Tax=Brevibacillus borstelensis TaxID=45462 RepID=UPI000F082F5D|nr:MBL fold metallo-hydrolase [Brevibacillus borstelensis]MED1883111.1 MBL fold metallo-hydrolase [Brevibacillus borstelensis]RNB65200.1 MBL fold metallo-hydrolase [Brevibacillus borstelensis]GED53208.1 Zn-dependent hydrolase [Brevibacillus borstelensis]
MLLKYFYDDKLAQASYLVGCQASGEAIVIDPARDIETYAKAAKANGVKIVGVTETHIHADFLSGAREIASRFGAALYLSDAGGADWRYQYASEYKHCLLKDGDTFQIGNLTFEVLHTPGHTPEHISLLLTDGGSSANEPIGIFTGDFVFVGDVGRPDLLEKAAKVSGSAEEMARKMFHSLARFKKLPDYLQVWPGHGAGSACGKAIGAVQSSTVGYEKRTNWALQHEHENDFIQELLAGQPEPPTYFAMMKQLNKMGPQLVQEIAAPLQAEASLDAVEAWVQQGMVVDTRPASMFAQRHLPGVINIPYDQSFVTWAGWLLDYDRPIYLLADKQSVPDIRKALQSIGLDQVASTMDLDVFELHDDSKFAKYEEVTPEEVGEQVQMGQIYVLDVRYAKEHADGCIPEAKHIMLGYLPASIQELPRDKPILVQCKSGRRSAIGVSLLQAHGFKNVRNLIGGFDEWVKQGLPIVRRETRRT